MFERLSFAWLFSLKKIQKKYICEECQKNFVLIQNEERCQGCGRSQKKDNLCYDCIRWKRNGEKELLKNRALFVYNAAMQNFMEGYKFKGDYYWRNVFQGKFEQNIHYYYNSGWIYVPVPVDKATLAERGFNQVTGLLQSLPFNEILQMKDFSARTKQSHKTRKQRLETQQPFEYSGGDINIKGKKVLLLDDVYTTGRTLYYAKELLSTKGVREVRSFTLAR
ncbi:phosphoribosyltransferase [Liquorilactobacillus aquaticus DSM 21051]|uniref:Phosphoribosyltransferase n=2 Tax=Liquorilactobacillus aquaticus TaxID=392566 RepID=A0A0R2CVY7_9LACO|nr:phosphoribosyltransferase [Liquorilactobacillus aquaticus DSM 21051]